MKFSACRIAAALVLAAMPAVLSAQWPEHRSSKIPRTADGKPKLDGPTPRTADGKPDLSGVWDYAGRIGLPRNFIPGVPNEPPPPKVTEGPPEATFFDVGSGIPGGLPLTPWAANVLKERKAENSKDNPDAHCLPLGLMQLHTHPQPRKMIQTPDMTVILYEAQAGIRQIFTDGRKRPPADVQPWWYGYSTGHWEGNTLVVETTGFRDDVWLDVFGSPLTNTGKMTERFRRPNYGTLQIDITIEDPKAYTKPFTVRVDHKIMPDTELIEFICTESDRSGPHLVGK